MGLEIPAGLSEIFCPETGFLTVSVRGRILITADGDRLIDDPWPDILWIVADFQIFQIPAAVKDPFSNMLDAFGQTHFCQRSTFEEGAVSDPDKGIWQFQKFQPTGIEGFLSDKFQGIREPDRFQAFAAAEGPASDYS